MGTHKELSQLASGDHRRLVLRRVVQQGANKPRACGLGHPSGLLEAGPAWRPGAYSSSDSVSELFGYFKSAVSENEYSRVTQHSMLYYNGLGRWVRLTASITTTLESQYHEVNAESNNTAASQIVKAPRTIPASIVSAVKLYLQSRTDVQQDSHISMFLGKSCSLEEPRKIKMRIFQPPSPIDTYLCDVASSIFHVGCPWDYENVLDSRPLFPGREGLFFIAFLGSRWVLFVRFASERKQVDTQMYHLRLLLHLRGSRRIIPFVGVVRNDLTGALTGFLCELPATGSLFDIFHESLQSKQPISRQRRLKCCRQIVEGVAELHTREFVAGTLVSEPHCAVYVDGHDNVVFFRRLQPSTSYNPREFGVWPPERWGSSLPNGHSPSVPVQPADEIYHLGILLWRVYKSLAIGEAKSQLLRQLCTDTYSQTEAFGSYHLRDYPGRQPEEIALPPLGDDAPQYLDDVIAACRTAKPEDRLPAWKLLEMFPPENPMQAGTDGSATAPYTCDGNCGPHDDQTSPDEESAGLTICRITRLEDCFRRIPFAVSCNFCGGFATDHSFKCSLCDSGDFDLCASCFHKGLHCYDLGHRLREDICTRSTDVYYSSPDHKGHRETTKL